LIFLCGVSSAAFDAFRSFDRFLCYTSALGHIWSEVPSGFLRYISFMNSKYCCCIQFSSEREGVTGSRFQRGSKRELGNALPILQNGFQHVLIVRICNMSPFRASRAGGSAVVFGKTNCLRVRNAHAEPRFDLILCNFSDTIWNELSYLFG